MELVPTATISPAQMSIPLDQLSLCLESSP
jgi:hypothetical protein